MTVADLNPRYTWAEGDEAPLGTNSPEIQAKVPHPMRDSRFVPKERYMHEELDRTIASRTE